jgi:hypothetical protein
MMDKVLDHVLNKKKEVFVILFVALFVWTINNYERREENLMAYLDKQSEINMKICNTLERFDVRLSSLEIGMKAR